MPYPLFLIGPFLAGAVLAGAYTVGVINHQMEVLHDWPQGKDNRIAGRPQHNINSIEFQCVNLKHNIPFLRGGHSSIFFNISCITL